MNASSNFEKLRSILLEEDSEKIKHLEARLAALQDQLGESEDLLEKLDPILTAAIAKKSTLETNEMAEALSPVVSISLKSQIETAKEDIVDALYPVIGSTIRKSIAEAMKSLARAVNEKIDAALTFDVLFRRFRSKMTGVSEGDLYLRDALPFEISEAFLIHSGTGLLIAHVSASGEEGESEKELISGMLTAISDFAATVMKDQPGGTLNQIEFGDSTITIEVGKYAYLAVVTSGVSPPEFGESINRCEQQIHYQFYRELREFDGDASTFVPAVSQMRRLFAVQEAEIQRLPGRRPNPFIKGFVVVLLLLGLGALLYYGIRAFSEYRARAAITENIDRFVALHPEYRNSGLSYELRSDTLQIAGTVRNLEERDHLLNFLIDIEGVAHLDDRLATSAPMVTSQQIRTLVQEKLGDRFSGDLDQVRFIVDGDRLRLEGHMARSEDRLLLADALADFLPFDVIANNITTDELLDPESLKRLISRTIVYFPENTARITPEKAQIVQSVARRLQAIRYGTLIISGHSDSLGSARQNAAIAQKRAENVWTVLLRSGIPGDKMRIEGRGAAAPIASNASSEGRARNRRVEFRFTDE